MIPGNETATDTSHVEYFDAVVGTSMLMENSGRSRATATSGSTISLPIKKSGIFGTSSNLVNSIVGAGIIGIPYAFRESGLLVGVFLLILVSYLTDKSLRMIVELASFHPLLKSRNVHTYEDLMAYPYGVIGSRFILLGMFILAYGAMVAYLLIIKDTIPTILGLSHGINGGVERELIMVVTTLIIILPLALQRDMASLSFTSFLSVSADAVLVIFVANVSPIKETVAEAGGMAQVLKNDSVNPTLFVGLGILSTAMACQHSAFIVSGSLENKTSTRWSTVTFRSLTLAAIMCLILGICGYLGFLGDTQGDILNNFDASSVQANTARGLLAFTMFFTYPMESFVARHVVVKLLFNGDMDGPIKEDGMTFAPMCCGLGRRHVVTIGIYLMTLIPALIVDDLGPVLSITGSLGGSCISYIAPGMVYLGVNGDAFLEYLRKICDSKRKAHSMGDIELPVAGQANATMQTAVVIDLEQQSKPWWWYPMLMPIWVSFASKGGSAIREKLAFEGSESFDNCDDEVETIGPRSRDYWLSIFYIVFGVIAAVAGVVSNIYVYLHPP